VVEALREGVAVTGAASDALAVGLDDARVSFGVSAFEPGEERGAEVEAEVGVVVDYGFDAPVRVDDAGVAVRAVALAVDALVPVVEGVRARLALDQIGPGVLSRRLVEMAVDDQRGRHRKMLLRKWMGKTAVKATTIPKKAKVKRQKAKGRRRLNPSSLLPFAFLLLPYFTVGRS
jgi:hypothetical protein